MKRNVTVRSMGLFPLILAIAIVLLITTAHAMRFGVVKHPVRSATMSYKGLCSSAMYSANIPGQHPVPIIRKPTNGSLIPVDDKDISGGQPFRYTHTTLVVCTRPDQKTLYVDAYYKIEGKDYVSPCLYHINKQSVFVDPQFGVAVNTNYRIRASYDRKHWGPWINFNVSTVPKAHPFPKPSK